MKKALKAKWPIMGEHSIPRTLGAAPGHRQSEVAPPKFVHISKELHMQPRKGVNAAGEKVIQGYDFVLHPGDGKTFRKPRFGNVQVLRSNDWGAEHYKLHRERSDAAARVRLAQEQAAAELL
jgi:hypothetical protein